MLLAANTRRRLDMLLQLSPNTYDTYLLPSNEPTNDVTERLAAVAIRATGQTTQVVSVCRHV